MRKLLDYIWFMSAALLVASCSKQEVSPDNGDKIAFYVKSQQAVTASSRALIEDTDDLLNQQPPLYVNDMTGGGVSDKKVDYKDNGVWRSDITWEDGRTYQFYAYIASPKLDKDGSAGVYVTNNGKTVVVQQPDNYGEEWSDFLLSYRVTANGSDKGLVRLDMERVTACVELYMGMGDGMDAVTVNSIEFKYIKKKGLFNNTYHAVPTDEGSDIDGMKNRWEVQTYYDMANYKIGNINLSKYQPENRFDSQYQKMKFLVVPQSIIDGPVLSIDYTTTENGVNADYKSDFKLFEYSVTEWDRGHKIKYFIGIDTSLKLEAVVEPWKAVDNIETTLLPKD